MENRITELTLPKKNRYDFYFCAFDIHAEKMHKPTYNIMIQHAKLIPSKHRKLIIGGDATECEHLMGKATDYKRWSKCVLTIEDKIEASETEFEFLNDLLDDMQRTFDDIIWMDGNHCWRYWHWSQFCPFEYRHHFDLPARLHLEERGIPYVKYPDYVDIGQTTIMHGTKHGMNHNTQHYKLIEGRDGLCGHVHHENCRSFATRGKSRKFRSSPCMSDLGPTFQIKNGENNWAHGYTVLSVRWDGEGSSTVHEPYKGSLALPSGKILKG